MNKILRTVEILVIVFAIGMLKIWLLEQLGFTPIGFRWMVAEVVIVAAIAAQLLVLFGRRLK